MQALTMESVWRLLLNNNRHAVAIETEEAQITYAELLGEVERNSGKSSHAAVQAVFDLLRRFKDNLLLKMSSSGTTGVPKEIVLAPASLVPCILFFAARLVRGDRVLLVAPCTFDPFVCDTMAAFVAGATLLVPPEVRDFVRLADFCRRRAPTVLHCTPSFLSRIPLSTREQMFGRSFRRLATGGEPPVQPEKMFPKAFQGFAPNFEYASLYGSTELSVWTCEKRLAPERDGCGELYCIGKPIDGTRVWLNDEGLIVMERGGVVFESRDMGKSCALCGCIQFCGRKDGVLKRFGKAISPFEIERRVLQLCRFAANCFVRMYSEVMLVLFVFCGPQTPKKVAKRAIHQLQLEDVNEVIILQRLEVKESCGKISEEFLSSVLEEKRRIRQGTELNVWKKLGMTAYDENKTLIENGVSSVNIHVVATWISERKSLPFETVLEQCVAAPVSRWAFATGHVVKADLGNAEWKYKTGKCVEAKCMVENGRLFCGSYDGILYCLRPEDGTLLWKVDIGDRIDVLAGGIVCGTRNGVVALVNAEDGKVVPEKGFLVEGSVRGIENVTARGILATSDVGVFLDGERIWDGVFLSGPCVGKDLRSFFCVAANGTLFCHDFAKCVWHRQIEVGGAFLSQPVLVSDDFVALNSVCCCYIVHKGSGNSIWTLKNEEFKVRKELIRAVLDRDKKKFYKKPVCLGSRVLFAGHFGLVVYSGGEMVRAVCRSFGHQVSITTSLLVLPESVLVAGTSEGEILRVWEDGSSSVLLNVGSAIYSDPIDAGEGRIVFGARDNCVTCFSLQRSSKRQKK